MYEIQYGGDEYIDVYMYNIFFAGWGVVNAIQIVFFFFFCDMNNMRCMSEAASYSSLDDSSSRSD